MRFHWPQIIRIVRLVRFITLLNRLYATAMAASAIILPGVTVSHNHAHFFNLLFGGAMLLNFLSCLWCASAELTAASLAPALSRRERFCCRSGACTASASYGKQQSTAAWDT